MEHLLHEYTHKLYIQIFSSKNTSFKKSFLLFVKKTILFIKSKQIKNYKLEYNKTNLLKMNITDDILILQNKEKYKIGGIK